MSAEVTDGRRSTSPPSSGRSSPVPRATRRTVEDGIFKADKSLRRYGANIERVLATWEVSPEEWADYIAFLGRLLKAIQTHPKDAPLLPHSVAIASKLAQCLNPALPSGVHQKALEVYAYIFSTFGNDYVSTHLHDYLPGLSAVLSFASLSVRPSLYALYEDHILQFPKHELRPVLKSLVLSLLPALEEDSSEDFERALRILQALEQRFTAAGKNERDLDGFFWQCLFLAVITSPSRRQGALNYLSRRLPTFSETVLSTVDSGKDGNNSGLSAAAECVITPEPGLLIRCFVCGLSDSQILIQRGFLDLLVSNLPLNSPVLQEKSGSADLDRLVTAATQVLLRKDMSLNRRLWSWFLGPEPKESNADKQKAQEGQRRESDGPMASSQLRYFSRYGMASLERCILKMLEIKKTLTAGKALPFRISLSLMDRWEIGGLLVPRIFLPAMRSLYEYSLEAPAASTAEVVRSASLFFDGVEASLIWESLLDSLRAEFEQKDAPKDGIKLSLWIINKFNVKDEEMLTIHIPNMVLYLASALNVPDTHQYSRTFEHEALVLTYKLMGLIPARTFQNRGKAPEARTQTTKDTLPDSTTTAKAVVDFYKSNDQSAARTAASPFNPSEFLLNIQTNLVRIMNTSLTNLGPDVFSQSVEIFLLLLSKAPGSFTPAMSALYDTLIDFFIQSADADQDIPFTVLSSTVSLIQTVRPTQTSDSHLTKDHLETLETVLTSHAWKYLSLTTPKYHVEAVKLLWHIEAMASPSDAFFDSLTSLARPQSSTTSKVYAQSDAARKFAVLWNHTVTLSSSKAAASSTSRRTSNLNASSDEKQSVRQQRALQRPLMLILDCLNDENSQDFEIVTSWLHQLPTLEAVLRIVFRQLDEIVTSDGLRASPDSYRAERYRNDQFRELQYIFGLFHSILTHGNAWTWQTLREMQIKPSDEAKESNGLTVLARSCIRFLCSEAHPSRDLNTRIIELLELILTVPSSSSLKQLELDAQILDRLLVCINGDLSSLQGRLLRLAALALKVRFTSTSVEEVRPQSSLGVKTSPSASMSPTSTNSNATATPTPPAQLLRCLKAGFSSTSSRLYMDSWLAFLTSVLPNFGDVIFANLLSVVECLCTALGKAHDELIALSLHEHAKEALAPEACISGTLDALEMILDRSYELLLKEIDAEPAAKSTEPSHNFLSSVTSSVFKTEGPPSKSTKANSKLTVILSFQDAIRVSLKLWLWATRATDNPAFDSTSSGTTSYNAIKVRNKTRHLLEQIFAVEPLESLEVIISYWCNASSDVEAAAGLSLLHVMQVTKPKHVVPAILDALCSRTNPSSLPANRVSSQTVDLTASETASFYSAYLSSTEDDAMDEIWQDCISFDRDVLSNPLPHRQVLPHLLSITLLLAEKLNNTNFGEQRKMRRDLGDIFQRMLIASFTTLPSNYITEHAASISSNGAGPSRKTTLEQSMGLIPVLNRVTSQLDLILETSERSAVAINNIAAHLISSLFHAKSFPRNISLEVLSLLTVMGQKAPTTRYWKKEVSDAFNDAKFLTSSPTLITEGWFPVLHQWTLHDKERMAELLSRLTPPASAGIMFGVGASAARLEADRRTQLNLRRVCLLLLASPEDTYAAHLRAMEEKIVELFEASLSSSPSTAIKAELFMLLRTLAIRVSSLSLAPMWPIINDKLQLALTSIMPNNATGQDFNNLSLLQACKLLGTLVTLSPDEFQLHEWLYITDTADAVYKSSDWGPSALSDQIAEALGSEGVDDSFDITSPVTPSTARHRRMLLNEDLAIDKDDVKALPKEDFVRAVLRPYLSQLSMLSYESVYGIDAPDLEALKGDLLADLLDISTVVEQ